MVLVVTDYAVVSEFVIKKTRDYSAVVSYSKQVCCLSSFNLHCVLVLFCPDMLICEDVRGMEAMSGQMDRVLDVLLSMNFGTDLSKLTFVTNICVFEKS